MLGGKVHLTRMGKRAFGVACLLIGLTTHLSLAGDPGQAQALVGALDYMVVVTGGEMLQGIYPDGHTHFLARALVPLGARCVGSMVVDDRAEDIVAAMKFATHRSRLVLVTGGLGPTPNDITRDVLSEFTGIALKEHSEVVADMEGRFGQKRDLLRPNLRRQALVPVNGGYLKNPQGTAVGLVFEAAGAVIVALPGPPRELQPMVQTQLVPWLRQRFGVRPAGASLTLRFVGLGQSQIDQTLKERVKLPPDTIVTSLFEGGRVDFSFGLPRDTADSRAQLVQLANDVRACLGDAIYGEGTSTLEQVVLEGMRRRRATLWLAEIGSHGQLAAALESTAEGDAVMRGACSSPDWPGLHRLFGLESETPDTVENPELRVRKWVQRVAARQPGDWVLAVGPAVVGASGEREVHAALAMGLNQIEARRFGVGGGSNETHRPNLTTPLLHWIWRLVR